MKPSLSSFLITLGLVGFALAGCVGSAPPVPRDHYYRLLVPAPAARAARPLFPGVLVVGGLSADGLLRERPLLYSASGGAHEVQQHDYHYWTDAPTRMLRDQMVTFLRESGLARAVVTPDLRVRPDYEVGGKIKRLERLLGGGPPRVFAELELSFLRLDDTRIVIVDRYAAEVVAADESVEASVVALNRAVAAIFNRFLEDLRRRGENREARS